MSQQTSPSAATPGQGSSERYWIRNDVGRVWGPYGLEAVGRINLGGGDLGARIQISTDGRSFQPLANFPQVVEVIERAAQTPRGPASLHGAKAPVVSAAAAPTPAVGVPSIAPGSAHPAGPATAPPSPPSDPTAAFPFAAEPVKPRVAPPQAADPDVPSEGTVDTTSVARLYARIAGAHFTGRLTVEAADGNYVLFFKKGTPERVEVPRPAESLGRFLVDREIVGEAEVENAINISGGPDAELMDAIVSLGLVPAQQLYGMLGEYGVEMLWRTLLLESGRFTWTAGTAPPAGSFPLGDRWDLLCRWARKLPRTSVRRWLGDRTSRAAYRSSGARTSLENLHLTAQEIRVASAFDGRRSPTQIAQDVAGDPDLALRTTLLLAEVGYLSFGPALHAASPVSTPPAGTAAAPPATAAPAAKPAPPEPTNGATPAAPRASTGTRIAPVAPAPAASAKAASPEQPAAPVAKPVAPPRPVAPPKAPAPAAKPISPPSIAPKAAAEKAPADKPQMAAAPAEDLESLRALLAKWKDANHFEVLGVPASAGSVEVKAAYLNLAKQHHPDTVSDPAQKELRALKEELVARVNEAFRVVGEAQSRNKYAAQIEGGGQVDIGPILQAEEDFLRATILVKARKFAEAIELLDRAIQLNPKEQEFYVWRAYSQFVSAKDKRSLYESAMAECARVAKEMPRCAAAHLLAGQMAKVMGDAARAEKLFRATLEIDPKNIDAKRELRGKE